MVVVALTIFNGCQKDELVLINQTSSEERFLYPGNLKSVDNETKKSFIERIIKDIEKQNKEKKFIDNFVKKFGYPDWELTRWFQTEDEMVAQIPVIHENGCQTEAIIVCVEKNNQIRFRLFVRNKFDDYKKNVKPAPTMEKVKDLFIIFDFQKFGESSYLENGYITNSLESNTKSASNYMIIETCYYLIVTTTSGELISFRRECETDYEWVNERAGGGGYYYDWYEESASNGSSSPTDGCNCNVCPVCGGCLDQPQLKSIPLPGDGETGEESISCPACSCPEVIEDLTFIGTKAECVKIKLENGSILNTLLAGFDLDQSLIDVTYKVGNLTGAYGECILNGRRIDITIDQDRLNATSIQLANTILHETFHAYIYGKLYDSELHTGLCPEPNFVDDFEAYNQQFGDQSQHNYMANKYIEYMRNGLQDYFGEESYRTTFLNYVGDMTQWYGEQNLMECLSWSGLKGTVAWSEYYSNQTNKTKYDQTMQDIVPLLPDEKCNN